MYVRTSIIIINNHALIYNDSTSDVSCQGERNGAIGFEISPQDLHVQFVDSSDIHNLRISDENPITMQKGWEFNIIFPLNFQFLSQSNMKSFPSDVIHILEYTRKTFFLLFHRNLWNAKRKSSSLQQNQVFVAGIHYRIVRHLNIIFIPTTPRTPRVTRLFQ